MSRHIIKVRSQAELEAAIAAGIITPPYIAFDSSSNTTNLVLPSGREPASIDYEEEEEPLWNSPQLVSNMYTTDSSSGEYTDASGNFQIVYAEDEREGWKYVDNLCFYLNSQYLEGWGSTAETIASEAAASSNTPYVFITEKDALDAVVEYQENTNGYSESKTLSYLVYDAIHEEREISGSSGTKTVTWPCGLMDGSETSFWGEDIEYGVSDVVSLEGYYMQPDNNKTPEYYILVAYKKEDEPLKASNENILRAPADYESMYKVYKAGIFSAYDYSEEGDEPGPDSSATSDASILRFVDADPNNNPGINFYPVIGTYNIDASMNYIKVVWPTRNDADDPTQSGYSSLDDFLNNYAFTYYSLTSGQTTETISASDIVVDQSNVLSFYAQFVNGHEETDENDNTSLVVDSSKEWIQIGYFALNPYVDCVAFTQGEQDYVQDNGDGTFDLQPYPNRDAVDAGYSYFKVGYSTADDDLTDPTVCAYVLQHNMVNTLYTGTESNPAQVSLNIGEGSGSIIAQVCDASGNFYTTDWLCNLGGWDYYPAPEEEPAE